MRACVCGILLRYRFTLPYEVAGFCTLLLPRGCHVGVVAQLRHGECVDPHNNLLLPVEAPDIIGEVFRSSLTSQARLMGTTSMSRAGRHRREKTTYIENSPIDCTR
jgi:hypothetical protein